MKIGIDARVLDRKMTGTGRYLKNLIDGIPKVNDKNEYFIFINNKEQFDNSFFEQVSVKLSPLPDKVYSSYWLNFILPHEAKRLKLDIFFTCNIVLPIRNLNETKKVTVVHDVIHKSNPDFYPASYRHYLDFMLPLTFRKADKVITASNFSKGDILKYFNTSEDKVEVLYTSADEKFSPRNLEENVKSSLSRKYNLPAEFLLYVGVIEKRKNIDGLFQVAEKLKAKSCKIPIVLVGRQGYGYDNILEKIEKSNGGIKYINYVEDDDLPLLYNMSKIFLFPSFYEGFGIPPLEAMQSGIPVISSTLTSLKEVLQDAAIGVNPTDINLMVDEIIKLNNNENYYNSIREKGLERARQFSHLKSANKLVDIFNNLK